MTAERRRNGAWVSAAILVWVGLAAALWNADRRSTAQDAAEQPREKVREQPELVPRSPAERRQMIRDMSPAEKERLWENAKRLAKLDEAKQERLRELCRQVEEDSNAGALLVVMHRYYDWLRMHPAAQLELASLPPERRVERIKKMLEAEDSARKSGSGPGFQWPRGDNPQGMLWRFRPRAAALKPDDMASVLKWLDEKYMKRHASELLAKISSSFREELEKQFNHAKARNDALRQYEVLGMILLRWQLENPKATLPLDDADVRELRSGLSESTRKSWESRPQAEQWRYASGLITSFVWMQAAARKAALSPVVSAEELAEFFQNGLSAEEQQKLNLLPSERLAEELARRYIAWKLGQRMPGPPGFGPAGKRGGPPGGRRGPAFGPPDFPPPGKPPAPDRGDRPPEDKGKG